MARKRYETAFIPATSCPTQYPDVDSLLLSIDSFSLDRMELERRNRRSEAREVPPPHHRWRSKSLNEEDQFLLERSGSVSSASPTYPKSPSLPTGTEEETLSGKKEEQGSRISNLISESSLERIPSGHSRSESPVRKMPISLSEPLHPRRHYALLLKSYASIQSSSGCSTNNSSSPVPSESQRTSSRSRSRRNPTTLHSKSPQVLSLMKLNSSSSLDSIESGRSDELKYLEKGSGPRLPPPPTSKLLSPISDKSPLEPLALSPQHSPHLKEIRQDGQTPLEGPLRVFGMKKQTLIPTAEQLTNLPWEMPKLKRKLALLVDSGISLDSQGSREPESRRWLIRKSQPMTSRTAPKDSSGMGKDKAIRRFPMEDSLPGGPDLVRHVGEGALGEDWGNLTGGPEIDATSFRVFPPPPPPPPPPEVPNTLSCKPDRCKMTLNIGQFSSSGRTEGNTEVINPKVNLEGQDWFHGAITRIEAEEILRVRKEGSFLVRNCESSVFNRYSLSLK